MPLYCLSGIGRIRFFKPGYNTFKVCTKSIGLFVVTLLLNLFCGGAAYAQAPVITPKVQLIFKLDKNGSCVLQPNDVATVLSSVTSNPVVTLSPNTFSCSSTGKQTVTVSARNNASAPDAGNLATRQVVVTIVSAMAFAEYDDVVVTADQNCKATMPDFRANPRIIDVCPNARINITQVPSPGIAIGVNKTTTVTLTAHDEYGGTASTFFNVTSLSKPEINPLSGPIQFKLDGNGNYTIKLSDLATVSSCDNGTVATTISPKSVTCADIGKTSVTLTASTSIPNPRAVTFSVPTDIVIDAKGNLFIADGHSCKIREISADGIVTTFVGGDCGFADGNAVQAKFEALKGITIDPVGNLYAIDDNSRVRKITPDGFVSTFAGNGVNTTTDGRGTAASFRDPRGITMDSKGNLYVTQGTDHLIRKITPAGDVTTFTQSADITKLYIPTGIVADAAGNLYVTDFSSSVKKIKPDGSVSVFAGHDGAGFDDGQGNAASFNLPKGITFDNKGNLYVTDSGNDAIRKIDAAGNVTTLDLYLDGTTDKALLNNPVGIKMDLLGNFVVVDSYNERIVRFTPEGQFNVITGNGVVGNNNGNANTPPFIGNQTVMNFPITVISSQNSTIPQGAVVPAVSVSPLDATACAGEPITFKVTTQPGDAIVNYQWLVNGIKAGSNATSFTTSKLNDGDIVTCITGNTASCILPKSSEPIIAHIHPLPQIAFGPNPVIKPGNSVQLQPTITGNIMSYSWSPSTGLNDTTLANPTATLENATTYRLTVTSTLGCVATDSVTVEVVTPIEVPNTFSPNGDGINDLWEISSLKYFPKCLVGVYNRNGQIIFYSQGYHKPWDGTLNGSGLAAGTYYYIIYPGVGNKKPVSGWVMIMR